jgi:hypothetical protein
VNVTTCSRPPSGPTRCANWSGATATLTVFEETATELGRTGGRGTNAAAYFEEEEEALRKANRVMVGNCMMMMMMIMMILEWIGWI